MFIQYKVHYHYYFIYNCYFRYLQEIGYTDTIIDVRSSRVRSLLGLSNNTDSEDMNTPALNGNEPSNKQASDNSDTGLLNSVRRTSEKKVEVNNF